MKYEYDKFWFIINIDIIQLGKILNQYNSRLEK